MVKKFINRPVLSTVISIMIVILGILGLYALPVTQYPEIAPPTVRVSANYPGANANTVLNSVVIPIEEQVNGVEGMDYISSSAGNNGSASVTVFFEQGIDADIAAVNVQNAVQRAMPVLPTEVTRSGVTTSKQNSSALMFLSFYTSNPTLNEVWLQNFLNINITPQIRRINGVSDAQAFGGKTYSMRVWLDPAKMATYGLEPTEVSNAINEQSREAAAGQLGENSGSSFQYVIRYQGKYDEVEDYENIILKSLGGGQHLRLKDVAEISLDALSYNSIGENSGNRSISMGIFQTPGSNAQQIIENVKVFLEETEKTLPEGVGYTINFDTNDFLEASISKVIYTILEAFVLVFLVVFIFLQDFRSTLIPAIAVPVSIVGTFFFLNLLSYSINLLTLFALVLAIGIVVDDAIVVVEAVHAKMEQGIDNAKKATGEAMDEITGAIISITLVMAAVFVPVTFMTGPAGVFYQQFGVTLLISILISAVNALTLSPVLCSIFLKSNHTNKEYAEMNLKDKFFYKFNSGFNAATRKYGNSFNFLFKHKWVTLLIFVAGGLTFWWANSTIKTGFIPKEDRGIIFTDVLLPPGASMERTYAVLRELMVEAEKIPGVQNVTFTASRGFMSGSGSNVGQAFVRLKPFDERYDAEGQSDADITKKLFGISAKFPDAKIVFFSPPSVRGFGSSDGFSAVILDRAGNELTELSSVAQNFVGALMQRPEIQFASAPFSTGYPQYEMVIDVPKAKEVGVSVSSILSAMQGYVGGIFSSDFTKYGKQFRVMIQSLPDDRQSTDDLHQYYVRTESGQMTPISQFVTMERTYGPQSIERYNLFTAVNITGSSNPGYSTGDAITALEETAAQHLPGDYTVELTGLSKEEQKAGAQTYIIFLLSFVFVYFILAAQYESFILPFAVILSLPLGVIGAYFGQRVFGLENNIYFQIAIVMLIGLLAKNAILIVEFAVQRRHHGESIETSAINAAKARLRPILMTSFAFIFGMLPLVFSSGIGMVANRSIGTGAAAGLLIGTVFGVFAIPVLYIIFQRLQEKVKPIDTQTLNTSE